MLVLLPAQEQALVASLNGFNPGSGTSFPAYLPLTGGGVDPNGAVYYVGTQRAFVTVEPGETPQGTVFRNSTSGGGNVFMTIFGYLVDI